MKKLLVLVFILIQMTGRSQDFPGQKDFAWPDYFVNYQSVPDSLKDEDAVILNEQIILTDDILRKRIAIKIQTEEGLKAFKKLQLPENFDLTNAPNWYLQGRFKHRKDPFIYSYKINYFGARILKPNKKFNELPLDYKSEKVYWVDTSGHRIYDYIHNFTFGDPAIGDIIEYMYEVNVNWYNKQNLIYPNGKYPKLSYDLEIKAGIRSEIKDIVIIYNHNIPTTAYTKTILNKNGSAIHNYKYHFDYLKGYNSISNLVPGFSLPSISVNHGYYLVLKPSGSAAVNSFYVIDKYKWILTGDTVKKNLYDKYHANIRKFISGLPVIENDSTGNLFASQLVDTLNKLKFVSVETMNYGDLPQYAIPSSEQLLKGRLTEEFVMKNYQDFLAEKGIFYYNGILIDKRKAIINHEYRNNYELERRLIVIPEGNRFKYYVPRHRGVCYLPDEIPFYFEGTGCALMPCSHCSGKGNKQQILFAGVPKSTFNENTRSEAASVRVSTDSMNLGFTIKENLGGQFSTLLRHYYNNDFIDSTVSAGFFKKCSDKPGFKTIVLKKGVLQKKFPFRQSYTCTGNIKLMNKNEINLKNWFSFTWTKEQFPKQPNHEIYTEFQLSDSYNILFDFDKPVEILNIDDLNKKLSNDYFEISSNIAKQEGNKYLWSVIVKVKQDMIPKTVTSKIMDFISMLDNLNDLKLNYKIL